jgi:hypothetical protein
VKRDETASPVFVQTDKENRTSKIPSMKIELGKNLSDLVIIGKSIDDIKTGFENINRALNIESEVKLENERKEAINQNVLEVKTILYETKINGTKIFLSNFKLNIQLEMNQADACKVNVDFNKAFSGFNLDFEGVENSLDKRFN